MARYPSFAVEVDDPVFTDGEEPGREGLDVVAGGRGGGPGGIATELDECVLNRVACLFEVAAQAQGITDEWSFEPGEGGQQPGLGQFLGQFRHRHGRRVGVHHGVGPGFLEFWQKKSRRPIWLDGMNVHP